MEEENFSEKEYGGVGNTPCSRRRARASAAALEGVMMRKSSTSRSSTDAAGVRCLAARARARGVSAGPTLACVDGVPPAQPPHQSYFAYTDISDIRSHI